MNVVQVFLFVESETCKYLVHSNGDNVMIYMFVLPKTVVDDTFMSKLSNNENIFNNFE